MSAILEGGEHAALPTTGSTWLQATVASVAVGILAGTTLGTIAAITAGTALRLLGAPDIWALGAAGLVALLSLLPATALGYRVWLAERNGFQD